MAALHGMPLTLASLQNTTHHSIQFTATTPYQPTKYHPPFQPMAPKFKHYGVCILGCVMEPPWTPYSLLGSSSGTPTKARLAIHFPSFSRAG